MMKELNKARIIISILLNILGNDCLSKKDNIYILILLLAKYNCLDGDILNELNIITRGQLKSYLKKAEEKILINIKFRIKYFDIEDNIKSII